MNRIICQEIVARDKTALLPDIAREPRAEDSGYERALYCAGVDVLAFEQFGDYQGTWWAEVRFPTGEQFFVTGSYGSCSGCDAFEAEFDWRDDEKPDFAHRLRDFGRGYLENCFTLEQAISEASANIEWDSDAQIAVDWLKQRQSAKEEPLNRADANQEQPR